MVSKGFKQRSSGSISFNTNLNEASNRGHIYMFYLSAFDQGFKSTPEFLFEVLHFSQKVLNLPVNDLEHFVISLHKTLPRVVVNLWL